MTDKPKIILDLCGGTGSWSRFYADDPEYEVRIIDPQEWLDEDSGTGDVRFFQLPDPKTDPIYGILAAPPCTIFSNAGARWWKNRSLEEKLDGISVMDACMRIVLACKMNGHPLKFWAVENPVGKMRRFLGNPTMTFQPNEFAGYLDDPRSDQYTKRTLLWSEFQIPAKKKLPAIDGSKMWAKYGGKSAATKRARSATPQGFAKAFYLTNQ
jgi:hypothetical protein